MDIIIMFVHVHFALLTIPVLFDMYMYTYNNMYMYYTHIIGCKFNN